jgi:cellobiose-specific phosphotransferase system component IIB
LELIESISDKKEKAKNKKTLNKQKNQSQAHKKSINSNADLANLTKTFDNFIKFCQNKFDLLENKITNNKKAANPNLNKTNKTTKNYKKICKDEKMELRNKILNLNKKDSIGLAKIIKNHSQISNESEMEFDLKKIPDKTLREIQEYVDVCLIKGKDDFMKNFNRTAKKTDKQIKEIKAKNLNNLLIYKEKTLEVNFVNYVNKIY